MEASSRPQSWTDELRISCFTSGVLVKEKFQHAAASTIQAKALPHNRVFPGRRCALLHCPRPRGDCHHANADEQERDAGEAEGGRHLWGDLAVGQCAVRVFVELPNFSSAVSLISWCSTDVFLSV